MVIDLETKIENLTNRFNSLIERLNKAGLKGTLDFSDLEVFESEEDIDFSDLNDNPESENQSDDFELMPK
jgi:hypothetical protein